MALMKVYIAPDKVLSSRAKEVDKVDDEIRTLMDDMLETMYDGHGVGLAANQVGVLKRVIVLDMQDDDDVERPEGFYPMKMANPKVLETSGDNVEGTEGCLSVPGIHVKVKRPNSIKMEYLDENNKKQEFECSGWLARAIQHEIDHLDGVTLVDRLSSLKKNVAIRKLNKYKKSVQKDLL